MENFSNQGHFQARQGGKMNSSRPDNRQRKPKDRQKGMVAAFVQGKGQNAALKWLMDSKTPVCIFLSACLVEVLFRLAEYLNGLT